MKKTTLIYALAALIALTAMVAVAQGRRASAPAAQPAAPFTNCQKALGLSQSQVAELTRIRAAFVNDTATLRTDLQAKCKEIADLWSAADPDLGLIKQKAAEADQIRAGIRDKAIEARGAILKELTTSQRTACLQRCRNGQCGCGMCGGLGMGMGLCGGAGAGMGACGMGAGNAAACPMGTGAGRGRGGAGRGMGGCGMGAGCPWRQ